MDNNVWTCPTCGRIGNTGNFCGGCGTPSPSTVNKRFINLSSGRMFDTKTGYFIELTENGEYFANDADGNEVYKIDSNGWLTVKTPTENDVGVFYKKFTIEDISNNMVIEGDDGSYYYEIREGKLVKSVISIDYDFGDDDSYREIRTSTYSEDGSIELDEFEEADGSRSYSKMYYGKDNHIYREERKDYVMIISNNIGQTIELNKDGTYTSSDEYGNFVTGTYTIDGKNTVLHDPNGNTITFDEYSNHLYTVDKDGVYYTYNVDKDSQRTIRNGVVTYSKINHIRYDEDAYNNILRTLNGIDGSNIGTMCSNVDDAVSGFPDKCSLGFSEIGSSINSHINQIKSLSSMANYSLLAYQTCDESLSNGLELLIDSLFSENELNLATHFKSIINSSIEDRDNDGILEYKKDADFIQISKNAITDSVYEFSNGDKWYLNKNGIVIGFDGNDTLDYGGETFKISFTSDGILCLKDVNGNALNIFGEYNLDTSQFGGNQCDLGKSYDNVYVNDVLNKYFPNSKMEEKVALLNKAEATGCGYTAVTNFVFKYYEGNEQGFYDTFGFPMYSIKKNNQGSFQVDYNYEPVIMDLYCEINSKYGTYDIRTTTEKGSGIWEDTVITMAYYARYEYGVEFDKLPEEVKYYGDNGYSLYSLDGTLYYSDGGGHAMVGVGKTEDGREYVSTWGEKYIYEASSNDKDSLYGTSLSQKYDD